MALRSLDPSTGYATPKKRKDMSPDELHYVDVVVPAQEAAKRRRAANGQRELAKSEAFQAMTEGHTTPEQIAKHLGWTLEKARFICGDIKT